MANRRRPDTSAMFKSMNAAEDVGKQNMNEVDQTTGASDGRKKRGPRKPKVANPMDRQSVKLGFYLTPRIYEAIQLHKNVNFIGVHNDSQIVNKALAAYLSAEIEALAKEDPDAPAEDRLRSASARLMAKKAN